MQLMMAAVREMIVATLHPVMRRIVLTEAPRHKVTPQTLCLRVSVSDSAREHNIGSLEDPLWRKFDSFGTIRRTNRCTRALSPILGSGCPTLRAG